MPLYKYDSYNRRGARVTGTIDAVSAGTAKELLRGQGLMPVRIEEVKEAGGGFSIQVNHEGDVFAIKRSHQRADAAVHFKFTLLGM